MQRIIAALAVGTFTLAPLTASAWSYSMPSSTMYNTSGYGYGSYGYGQPYDSGVYYYNNYQIPPVQRPYYTLAMPPTYGYGYGYGYGQQYGYQSTGDYYPYYYYTYTPMVYVSYY